MRNIIDLVYFINYICITYILLNINFQIGLVFASFVLIAKYVIHKKTETQRASAYLNVIQQQQDYFKDKLKHDISIPVIAQLRGIEFLKKNCSCLTETEIEIVSEIEKSCKYLLDMIYMLIDGHYEEYTAENAEIFDIISQIKESIELVEKEHNEKNIKFRFNSNVQEAFINADKTAIQKVLNNMLMNAVNYTKANDKIIINSELKKNNICVDILSTSNTCSENFTTVGEDIGTKFCKRIIEINNGSFKEQKQNTDRSFSFPSVKVSAHSCLEG